VPRYNPRTGELDTYQVGPFDTAHLYVQWGGKLPGGEQWSCGFRMWRADGSDDADAVTNLTRVGAAISAFHSRATTGISNRALLSFVKCNAITVTGHYVGSGTNQTVFPDIAGGANTNSGVVPPNQIALAVSLTTGFSRGAAHRGRFFLPLPMSDTGYDGLATVNFTDAVKTSCDQLLTAVNAGGGEQMVIMSRKAGAPGHRFVTGFQVGRVLDTQRRRRGSLAENYS
jgi:hypothetical protein